MEPYLTEITQQAAAFWTFITPKNSPMDDPEVLVRIVVQVFLLIGSALFSSSETALFSLSRIDLQNLLKQKHPLATTINNLLEQPRRLIISILCGNELLNIAAAANMTIILVKLYGQEDAGWITLLLMVPLLLVFGEVTPKTIAVSNPVVVSTRIIVPVIRIWIKLVAPLRWVVWKISDRVTTLLVGKEKSSDNILHIDEFRTLVDDVVKNGELGSSEKLMIFNLLEAGATEVIEIMIPRTQIPFVNITWDKQQLKQFICQNKMHHFPVYKKDRDNFIGFIHAADVAGIFLDPGLQANDFNIKSLLYDPIVIPPTKKVNEMLDFFKTHEIKSAIVLNEFGGVEGLVTLEQVLQFVFGEICPKDTFPDVNHDPRTNIYDVPGDMKLIHIEDLTHFVIKDNRMTTIGGVVFRKLDRLPKVGDQVQLEDLLMTVLAMDGHRISRVQLAKGVKMKEPPAPAKGTANYEREQI
ncbi:hemolysin family protein [methanotrophic endosymbiont of Bathymodiolus puteoserpentis (Logatchev)]|jgi:CBS domain containing-hemolysin-like protein|uniref:hemolysin family protein n=1 Tax=methanotrophic endosymbiont of Bathymodiolus puteoserpentis (Logatchev) TaxID=343235 RepID=UPI0013C88BC6|nr:hemolysin family protein [methanotrophic endosymbiont of Bathymodiolus puteoserpentis (Logatchev)]SHE21714.1 Magnesium and cobalt efflux protein CorC [methanotrophic endosymbiont of Bathymodiolus puteoserpentis (Logatchev)]